MRDRRQVGTVEGSEVAIEWILKSDRRPHRGGPGRRAQLAALALLLLVDWAIFPGFFRLSVTGGRLTGSLVDVLDRGAPVALLALGMTPVIATRGIDLSVGAVMAIAGASAATASVAGAPWPVAVACALVPGSPRACGTGCWWQCSAFSRSSPPSC